MNRSGPMVAVCLAPVDLRPEVDELSGAVRTDPRRADLPAGEAAALEYGLRLAETWGGWVLVAAFGPIEADEALREALALAAEVVRVAEADPAGHGADSGPVPVSPADLAGNPALVAGLLARAIRDRGRPAVVLCGDRSGRAGVGAVPGFLAAELGLDQALGLVTLRADGPSRLLAERRLDGGWRERLLITGPAVVSVEAAGVRLRRAPLVAALDVDLSRVDVVAGPGAFSRPGVPGMPGGPVVSGVPGMQVSAPRPYRPRTRPVPAPAGDARARLLSLTGALSTPEPARVVGPVTPAEAAAELLAYLARLGYTAG